MTESEIAELPEARLGGSLLWLVVAAAVIVLVPILGFLAMIVALMSGSLHGGPLEFLIGIVGGPVHLGMRLMVPVGFLVVWALLFLAMTALRLSATPLFAGASLVLWVALRFALAYVGDSVMDARDTGGSLAASLTFLWPFLMSVLGEAAMAAAFCGYMLGGVRPNAYYRRRLPAV